MGSPFEKCNLYLVKRPGYTKAIDKKFMFPKEK